MVNSYQSFPVLLCKKISTKTDEISGIKIYVGQAPITSFENIPDNENVRSYIVEANIKHKKSEVHKSIDDTLKHHPSNFPLLNSGITIVARDIEFDNKQENIIKLCAPSIINGSQTQGVIKDFLKNHINEDPSGERNAQYEIIVTKDEDFVSEISIARNTQIRVEKISILGAREIFDELEKRIQEDYKKKKNKSVSLRKSETDRQNEYLPTEKLLQIIATLIPEGKLWELTGNKEFHKSKFYARASRALDLYNKIHANKDNKTSELYKFYLDIAYDAWELYQKWCLHQGFAGTNIRNGIERDNNNKILKVYDGLIYPAIAAHSVFVKKDNNGCWYLPNSASETDKELITILKQTFQEVAYSKVEVMGKTQSCYSMLWLTAKMINSHNR